MLRFLGTLGKKKRSPRVRELSRSIHCMRYLFILSILFLFPFSASAVVLSSQLNKNVMESFCYDSSAGSCGSPYFFALYNQPVAQQVSGTLRSVELYGRAYSRARVDLYRGSNVSCSLDREFVEYLDATSTPSVGSVWLTPRSGEIVLNASKYYCLSIGPEDTDHLLDLYGSSVTSSSDFYDLMNWSNTADSAPSDLHGMYSLYYRVHDTVAPPSDFDYTRSKILSLSPENGTTTSNPVTFAFDVYIAPEDLVNALGSVKVHVEMRNIDQNMLFGTGWLSPSDIVLYDVLLTESGFVTYSTSTPVGEGNYRVRLTLDKHYLIDYDSLDSLSHQFIVGQSSFIGTISQSSYSALNAIFASSSATSTAALARSCYPFSGQFDTINCLAFLFVPDAGLLSDSVNEFKDEVLTRFPLGYVTDFVSLIGTSTPSSAVVFEMTVPSSLPGGGSQLALSVAGVLDPILDARIDDFETSTEDDARTFYEITYDYWLIFVALATLFYLLRRVLGSHLIRI